jgi:dihydrofolate reductase
MWRVSCPSFAFAASPSPSTALGQGLTVRGAWPDDEWKGWWGDEPPYHTDVFVLTHHARAPLAMAGIQVALQRARASAKGRDVRLGGGVNVIRQYLQAGLIDEMHLVVSPVLLGKGEHLFSGIDMVGLGFACTEHVTTPKATHVVLTRSK